MTDMANIPSQTGCGVASKGSGLAARDPRRDWPGSLHQYGTGNTRTRFGRVPTSRVCFPELTAHRGEATLQAFGSGHQRPAEAAAAPVAVPPAVTTPARMPRPPLGTILAAFSSRSGSRPLAPQSWTRSGSVSETGVPQRERSCGVRAGESRQAPPVVACLRLREGETGRSRERPRLADTTRMESHFIHADCLRMRDLGAGR